MSNRWKRVFLSTSMFNGWPYSCWPSCRPCWHSPCGGCNRLQLPALLRFRVHSKNCLCWVDHECLSTWTPHPWSLPNITLFESQCLVLGLLASPVCLVSQSHSSKFFSGSGHHIGQGRRSCPCTAYDQFLPLFLSDLSLWHGLLLGVVLPSVCLYPDAHPCHKCNCWSHRVCTFCCRNVCVF